MIKEAITRVTNTTKEFSSKGYGVGNYNVQDIELLLRLVNKKTPANTWHEKGEADPHSSSTTYDGDRSKLCMGYLTDDELANGVFMNYDANLSIHDMVNGVPTPIVWVTAAKERIRWLSRKLLKSQETLIQDTVIPN